MELRPTGWRGGRALLGSLIYRGGPCEVVVTDRAGTSWPHPIYGIRIRVIEERGGAVVMDRRSPWFEGRNLPDFCRRIERLVTEHLVLPLSRCSRDADCDVDRVTNECRRCGVVHGPPCPGCGSRAYHLPDCTFLVALDQQVKEALG